MKEVTSLTMKDIAREFGISVATVSRALKDSPRISAERRAAIQQYAREHNFAPNMISDWRDSSGAGALLFLDRAGRY